MPVTRAAQTRRAKELEAAADPAALVLELLLQHAQPEQAWVCALLRSSKATADALAERLAGTLCVKAAPRSVADALGLSFWVRRHGRLLAELEFKPAVPDDAVADASADDLSSGNDAAGHLLASALSEAAGGLQRLRAFTCRTPDAAPDLLLLLLPNCSALTRLDIALGPVTGAVEPDADSEELVLHAMYASMARMTWLRELRLETHHFYGGYEDAATWTPALSVLTALTSLQLSGVYLGESGGVQPITIDSLPPSLRRFEAHTCCDGIYMSRPLLTEFIFDGSINERDELPPTLVRLECGGLASLKPLQRLHSLKSVRGCIMSDACKAELAARGVTVE